MARIITASEVGKATAEGLKSLAFNLPPDILAAMKEARKIETNPRGAQALDLLLENAEVAATMAGPLCQDTGYVWCCLEIGPDITLTGDVFSQVNANVAAVYDRNYLRKSLVRDSLFNRENTKDNTPAFCEVRFSETPGARLHLMAKGGGSDNASRVVMLAPGVSREGVKEAVLSCVHEKAANACPPLVVAVAVGGTFDSVAHLAKEALLEPLDSPAQSPQAEAFAAELLEAINETGIGPAALGGKTTALGVRVRTAPSHIAAMPLAINMGCSALRRATYEL